MTDHPFTAGAEIVKRATALPAAIAADLSLSGGILRCEQCGGERPLDDVAGYLAHGWPAHCGKTMTWVTLKLLAAESWGPVPEGHELAAVPDEAWRLEPGKRCTRRLKGNRPCREPSVAALNRARTARATSGRTTPSWWPHCIGHLDGRWIADGQVWHWVLREAGQ